MKFNNRDFFIGKTKGIPKLNEITLPNTLPKQISKYYPLNNYSVNNLLKDQIYVSSYDHLNDIIDSLYLRIELDNIDFDTLWRLISNAGYNYQEEKDKFNHNPQLFRMEIRDTIHAILLPFFGLFCVTEKQDNDLMWAHYSNNNGFLIEYEVSELPDIFGTPLRMNYLKEISKIKPERKDLAVCVFLNLLIKKNLWEYESEFRFIVTSSDDKQFETMGIFSNEKTPWEKASRLININQKAINKIVLGFNFFKEYIILNDLKKGTAKFIGEDGELRASLLEFALQNNISVELVYIDTTDFSLKLKQINIIRFGLHQYQIQSI